MLRIHLSDDQRSELQALRQTDLPAVARTRLEMVFLSDAGWSAPKIAQHSGRHPHTVRSALKGFRDRGAAAFHPDKPGPDPDHRHFWTSNVVWPGRLLTMSSTHRQCSTTQSANALYPAEPNALVRRDARDVGPGHG